MAAATPSRPEPTAAEVYAVLASFLRPLAGGSVDRVTLTFLSADGREATLPVCFPGDEEEAIEETATELTERQQATIQVINEMAIGEVKTTQKLADDAGYSNTGAFRDFLKKIEADGRIKIIKPLGIKRLS